ncbi:kinase domain protein [Fusarium beomiforme]|uniref:Kinase domain protein n=1 Tax=Fusarium beomiforme TaxID=44412 RepID=A0A9P5DSZ3_9HYPO|nr:kinase domain protein [Fusarium beomiforme]
MYKNNLPQAIPDPIETVMAFILKEARKVFAIWVLVGIKGLKLYATMELFRTNSACDTALPFEEDQISSFTISKEYSEIVFLIAGKEPFCDEDHIYDFCQKQWEFCAPVFDCKKDNHDLNESAILPFTEKHLTTANEGAFGQVLKYTIHNRHINTTGLMPHPQYVAVKKIKLETQNDPKINIAGWEKEVRALWKMRELRQKHIVKFITAFRRGMDEHYLIMEWADGGNLRNLWENFRQPLTANLVKDAFKQLLGLSEALDQVHNPRAQSANGHFRHGDLKPENILWFKDPTDKRKIGILKIGDWGLAKQHQDFTQIRTKQTTTGFGTRRYEPPEEETIKDNNLVVPDAQTVLGRIVRKRSRLYDVWAMGCIWLEFLIWLMYGHDGLTRFNRSFKNGRSDVVCFYEIDDKDVARVHRVAKQWMDHMAQDPVCEVGKTALGNLLELVRSRLLVVKLPDGFGTIINLPSQPGTNIDISTTPEHIIDLPPSGSASSSIIVPQINVVEAGPVDEVLPATLESFVPKPPLSTGGRRARSDDLFK